MDEAELDLRRGVTRGRDYPLKWADFSPLLVSEIFPMLSLEALSRKEPTRLEVIMVQANQSGT
jgi:hypothetical protein